MKERVVRKGGIERMLRVCFALFVWSLGLIPANINPVVLLVATCLECLASKSGFDNEETQESVHNAIRNVQ